MDGEIVHLSALCPAPYDAGLRYREKIAALLQKRIEAFQKGYRQNVGLIGKPFLGKTYFLHHFLQTQIQPDVMPLYVELLPEPFEFFAQKYMGTILARVLPQPHGATSHTELTPLIQKARKLIPKTVRKMHDVMRLLKRGELDQAFAELLGLTVVLHEETQKKIIVVLDEFDHLEQWSLTDPFSALGRAIMVQPQTLFVVVSSHPALASSIFHEKLTLLFGNFEVIDVQPFDFKTTIQFLEDDLKGFQVVSGVFSFLTLLTNGSPFYLKRVVESIQKVLHGRNGEVIDREVVAEALKMELFCEEGLCFQHFSSRLQKLQKTKTDFGHLPVLLAVAGGFRKLQQIAAATAKKVDEVKKLLGRMLEEEVVEKRGSFYVIDDYLLRFWLHHVYQRRLKTFSLDKQEGADYFKREVIRLMERFEIENKKDLTLRVEELLKEFRNDVVEFRKHRFQCPSFSEVLARPSNGRVFPIYARSPRGRWFCQIAREKVSEEDIRNFVTDSKKYRRTLNRKIMISPCGIDLNAKLLAQEERIAVWDLKDLNLMLDLYEKPKVIL